MATAAGEAGAKPGSRWHLPHLAPLVGVAVVALAAYVIHRVSAEVHLADIEAALAATPLRSILLGLLLTATSFLAMSLYDVLGAEQVAPGRVPKPIAAFAGAAAGVATLALDTHPALPLLACIAVTFALRAGSIALMPKDPKFRSVPPLASPLMRPLCSLRNLVRFG